MRTIKLLQTSIILLLLIGFTACSDNGAGTEAGEPPAIPEIGEVLTPDINYFENNNVAKSEQFASTKNFNEAKLIVTVNIGLLSIGQIYSGLLEMAENEEATYENGQWVWEYTYSESGGTAKIKLTAKENSGNGTVNWAFFVSESEQNIENYKFMEGTVAADGSSGNWKIYAFTQEGPSQAQFSFDWIITAEDDLELTLTYNLAEEEGSLSYSREGSIFELTVSPVSSNTTAVVHLDISTQNGYYINLEGVKSCWDSNFQDVTCS